jgi:hypothetical protein
MMKQLIDTKQCEINNQQYIFELYKGTAVRTGRYEFNGTEYTGAVGIKAYRIVVKEVNTQDIHDCGYCTSRAGEAHYAIKSMMRACDSMFDMKMYMVGFEERNRTVMDRDAAIALKVQLGLQNQRPANVRSALQKFPQKTKRY